MIRFFTAHPTAGNLLMCLLIVVGLITLPTIKRETFPSIKRYSAEIRVPYPGATPLDVEQGICVVLEDALDGIGFMEEKSCQAQQNLGLMTVKMLEQGDFSVFLADVNSAVDSINDFPDEAESATVKEVGRTQNVVSVALMADLPRTDLKTLAEQLKQTLLRHPDIALVTLQGFSDRQLRIEISNEQLRQYGLSLQDFANIIREQDLDLPVGSIETHFQETQIRFKDERRSIAELAELIIISGQRGSEIRLGDVATITDTFELAEEKVTYNGKPAALLQVNKNTVDDSLVVLQAVEEVIAQAQATYPDGINVSLTQDATSIVKDRIRLLLSNAWQGLLLVFAVMWLFFAFRYAFWVVLGLPVSFLASFFVLGHIGVTINMISLVAFLLALGILMDDAIVVSESIGSQIKKGLPPLKAAIVGTTTVARGVLSSFATTLCMFVGLVFIQGDLGQILKVIPIVLICVITVSLFEAFFILPGHLYHTLSKAHDKPETRFRRAFNQWFERLSYQVLNLVNEIIKIRYFFIGSVLAVFFLSISMLASGTLKFSAFPSIDGDLVQARIIMPSGTPLAQTEVLVAHLLDSLEKTKASFQANESAALIKAITVSYNENSDAFESGPHLATISVDLLTAETRDTKLQAFINAWRTHTGVTPQAQSITFKESGIGPSGRAIQIRLFGDDFAQLSKASYDLQHWLSGYPGVHNVIDDLRLGKSEYAITLKPGALTLGLNAQIIANQLRAAFQGIDIVQTYIALEAYDITAILAKSSRDDFGDFDTFAIIHPQNQAVIPLSSVADIQPTRGYARLSRVNNQRTVTVYGDIDVDQNNTKLVLADVEKHWVPHLAQAYPNLRYSFEGEIKNAGTTQKSMRRAFFFGLIGVFILLSFQFKNYLEPCVVLVAIPLSLIGVIWGHLLMGLQFTMPSMLGFVSLAGIVVNDAILLVESVKKRVEQGVDIQTAAVKASNDRFRAVLLTSITTIAGMTPLLFESSLQAQVLIPLATSIVFGIATSTFLVLCVIPCLYVILHDLGFAQIENHEDSVSV